jgi:hypothetical protein
MRCDARVGVNTYPPANALRSWWWPTLQSTVSGMEQAGCIGSGVVEWQARAAAPAVDYFGGQGVHKEGTGGSLSRKRRR